MIVSILFTTYTVTEGNDDLVEVSVLRAGYIDGPLVLTAVTIPGTALGK